MQDIARLTLSALRSDKADRKLFTFAGPRAWTTQEVEIEGGYPLLRVYKVLTFWSTLITFTYIIIAMVDQGFFQAWFLLA